MKYPRINENRMWNDLIKLGSIGYHKGMGVTRTALSKADFAARSWLENRAKEFGFHTRNDQAFNQIIQIGNLSRPVCVVGSHLDTVPNGGMFDGTLGVVAGLECARTIVENKISLSHDLEIINFCDEEAAHHAGTIGSRAMLGLLKKKEIFIKRNKTSVSFAEHLCNVGGDPLKICAARRDLRKIKFYLELHIEQGNRLESEKIKIGVVTGICAIDRLAIKVMGTAAHAGTTPMHLRDDALLKATQLIQKIPKWVQNQNRQMVGTVGSLTVYPGAVNVIPGRCEFIIELRSQHSKDTQKIIKKIQNYISKHEGFYAKSIYSKEGICMDEKVQIVIEASAKYEKQKSIRIASGAGHDAQSFASKGISTGMIFIPCKKGISHSPHESISRKDAQIGCQTLLNSILQLTAS